MDTTVYLIRHSLRYKKSNLNYVHVDENNILLNEKIVLSPEGEKRAYILCNKHIFDNIDVIYSSNLARSIGTCKYLADRLNKKINIDSRLDERKVLYPNNNISFIKQYENPYFKTKGSESQMDVRNRFTSAFNEIVSNNKYKNICIFSHGYAITFFLLNYCKYEGYINDNIVISYKGNILLNRKLNSPEVFKLVLDDNLNIKSINLIEFDDLPYDYSI